MRLPDSEQLERIYGESEKSTARFKSLAERFLQRYGREAAIGRAHV